MKDTNLMPPCCRWEATENIYVHIIDLAFTEAIIVDEKV